LMVFVLISFCAQKCCITSHFICLGWHPLLFNILLR
jgi:hypothetical protein